MTPYTILIPANNEEAALGAVLEGLRGLDPVPSPGSSRLRHRHRRGDPRPGLPPRHPLYRGLARFVIDRARAVTAISSPIAEAVRGYHGGKDIRVISPGLKPYPAPAVPERGSDPAMRGEFRICTLCRLAQRKGIETVLEALAGLGDIPFRYHILGDGPSRGALEKLAADLGVSDRTVFAGFFTQEELTAALRTLHSQPSLRESMGAATRGRCAEYAMDRIADQYQYLDLDRHGRAD